MIDLSTSALIVTFTFSLLLVACNLKMLEVKCSARWGNCDFMNMNLSKEVCSKKESWTRVVAGGMAEVGEGGWTIGSGCAKGWTSQNWSLNIAGRTALTCCLLGEKRKRQTHKGGPVDGDRFEMQRKPLSLICYGLRACMRVCERSRRTNIWHHKSHYFK